MLYVYCEQIEEGLSLLYLKIGHCAFPPSRPSIISASFVSMSNYVGTVARKEDLTGHRRPYHYHNKTRYTERTG